MRRRWVKLLGATIALGAAALAAEFTTMALDAGLWWLASLTAVAVWPFLAVTVARDAWAELERRLGGES